MHHRRSEMVHARLDPRLVMMMWDEARRRRTTLSEILRLAIRARYGIGEGAEPLPAWPDPPAPHI